MLIGGYIITFLMAIAILLRINPSCREICCKS